MNIVNLLKPFIFTVLKEYFFLVKSFVEEKLAYGENLSSVKINRRGE